MHAKSIFPPILKNPPAEIITKITDRLKGENAQSLLEE